MRNNKRRFKKRIDDSPHKQTSPIADANAMANPYSPAATTRSTYLAYRPDTSTGVPSSSVAAAVRVTYAVDSAVSRTIAASASYSPSAQQYQYQTSQSQSQPIIASYYAPSSSSSPFPSPSPSPSTPSNSTSTAISGQDTSSNSAQARGPWNMSMPLFIGCTVAVAVFVAIVLGVGIWLCCRCKKRRRARRLRENDEGRVRAGLRGSENNGDGEMREIDLFEGEGERPTLVSSSSRRTRSRGRQRPRPATLTREEVRDILPHLPISGPRSSMVHRPSLISTTTGPYGNGTQRDFDYDRDLPLPPHVQLAPSVPSLPSARPNGNSNARFVPPQPRSRDSMWADDSEFDVMAEAGSSIARTLSVTSTSTRARYIEEDENPFDHPAYTYRRPTITTSTRAGTGTGTWNGTGTGTWNGTGSTESPISPITPNSATPLAPWSDNIGMAMLNPNADGGSEANSPISPVSPSFHPHPHPQSTMSSQPRQPPSPYGYYSQQAPSRSFTNPGEDYYSHSSYLSAPPQQRQQPLSRSASQTQQANPRYARSASQHQHAQQPNLHSTFHTNTAPDIETQSIHSEDGLSERPSIDPRTGLRRGITIIRHSDATTLRPGAYSTRVEREGGRGAGLVELPPLYEEALGR